MRRLGVFILAAGLWAGTPAQAQPISWGMAQCAALMGVMESHVSRQPQKGYLAQAADALFDAAQVQSRTEGRDPAELTVVHGDKQDEWIAMGYSMAFKSEFRDWVDYCKSLARSYQVPLNASLLR